MLIYMFIYILVSSSYFHFFYKGINGSFKLTLKVKLIITIRYIKLFDTVIKE